MTRLLNLAGQPPGLIAPAPSEDVSDLAPDRGGGVVASGLLPDSGCDDRPLLFETQDS